MASKKEVAGRPEYQKWRRRQERIADLFLDPENVRLENVDQTSQQSLINDLFLNENAMQLLESIALNGFFPDELPVVVAEKGKLVVVEGNRRVAALKALARPEIVATKESAIRALLRTAIPFPREVEVIQAPDRRSIRRLLAAKHTQTTRRPWSPLRQAAFYKAELESGKTVDDLRQEYPAVDIEKFLRLINIHRIAKSLAYADPEVARKVHHERQFPATTLERLYDDHQVREFLGFEFDDSGEVKVKIVKAEFEKGFRKVVEDVVTKAAVQFGRVDSRTLNKEKNRAAYLASFPRHQVPIRKKSGSAATSKDFEPREEPPKQRRRLAPKDIAFELQSRGVHRMLGELQTIDYRRFSNAAHDLLRSFLECALKAYFQEAGRSIVPKKGKYVYLDQVLEEFVKEMGATRNNRLRQVAQRIRDNESMVSYSATFLNAVNHNPDIFVTPNEVASAWDAMEPLFRFLLLKPAKSDASAGSH
jgi:hypothetical protein